MQTMIELGAVAKPFVFALMTLGSLLAIPIILSIDKRDGEIK